MQPQTAPQKLAAGAFTRGTAATRRSQRCPGPSHMMMAGMHTGLAGLWKDGGEHLAMALCFYRWRVFT